MNEIAKDDIYDNDSGHYIICPVYGSRIWFNGEYEKHHIVENIMTLGRILHR